MSLTDGEVAALASQVAGLIESWLPNSPRVDARIDPPRGDDPYRWPDSATWTVYFDVDPAPDNTVAVRLLGEMSPGSALYGLVDGLDEISETTEYRGRAFPPCSSGHPHPARVEQDGDDVVLRCPNTGEVVQRVAPDVP